jgi:glucose/arabinose dehydrogenase
MIRSCPKYTRPFFIHIFQTIFRISDVRIFIISVFRYNNRLKISTIKLCLYYIIITATTLFLIQQFIDHQPLNASIPKPGTLPLLNDSSITLSDPRLKIEIFATGLKEPTNMAFLDSGDVLVLEKQNGTVRKIVNGNLLPNPLVDVNVANYDTRGMLGIAVTKNETAGKQYVFLYYTEAKEGRADGEDRCLSPFNCILEYLPNGNRLYRFELSQDGSKLINPKLIFTWPPLKRADHNGGELIVGPDNNLYLIVGYGNSKSSAVTNNNEKPRKIEGGGGILAFNHNGGPIFDKGILGDQTPLNRYYAYGIRNGFGLDFDPVTGTLWDTENGPEFGDEINLVVPGFNSGWNKIQGTWEVIHGTNGTRISGQISSEYENTLVNFTGKGKYRSPEFTWKQTIGVTAIKFLNSSKYGKKYQNDIFVGSVKPNGTLYHFDLNPNRMHLDLQGLLKDRVADNYQEQQKVAFGKNFGIISDITVGPDGYLYIVSLTNGQIYRLIPKGN